VTAGLEHGFVWLKLKKKKGKGSGFM